MANLTDRCMLVFSCLHAPDKEGGEREEEKEGKRRGRKRKKKEKQGRNEKKAKCMDIT